MTKAARIHLQDIKYRVNSDIITHLESRNKRLGFKISPKIIREILRKMAIDYEMDFINEENRVYGRNMVAALSSSIIGITMGALVISVSSGTVGGLSGLTIASLSALIPMLYIMLKTQKSSSLRIARAKIMYVREVLNDEDDENGENAIYIQRCFRDTSIYCI